MILKKKNLNQLKLSRLTYYPGYKIDITQTKKKIEQIIIQGINCWCELL